MGIVVAVVLLTGLVAGIVAAAILSQSTGPVDAEIERLRAAGLPATPQEVFGVVPRAAAPASPADEAEGAESADDDDNGARDIEAALAWHREEFGPWDTWGVTGPWDPNAQDPWYEHTTPEQLAALRAFLERSWPFFDRLNDALDKPRIAFVPQFDASGVPSFDYVRPIQRVLPLLSARAVAAPAQRERISAMVAAARLFRRLETRSLHELFIAMSAQAVAIREARAAAEDGTIPAADLLRALDRELDVSLVPRLAAAARGEPALVASAWRAWRSGPSASSASRRPLKRLVRSLERMFTPTADPLQFEDLSSDDLARWMRVWSEVAEIDASSPETFRAAMEAVLQRNPSNPGGHVGELKRVADHVLRHDSASRLARVALAAKAHREATGAWPATLDALAPALGGAVPVDARNGKPFVYSTDGPKVRLAAPGDGTANDEQLRDQLVLWEFPK